MTVDDLVKLLEGKLDMEVVVLCPHDSERRPVFAVYVENKGQYNSRVVIESRKKG